MLKFVLVAFLFLGLAVQGQESQETEVAEDAMNFNEKVSTKFSEDSEENVESQEEDSEEDEQADYSGAVEEVVSEDNNENEEVEDENGSEMVEENEDNEEDENDESGSGCFKPRCRYYIHARNVFYRFRNACHRCLRARRAHCNRQCRIYHAHRRHRYTVCRRWTNHHLRGWHHHLRVNLQRLRHANAQVRRLLYLIRLYHRRAKGLAWRVVVARRLHYYRAYHAHNRARHHFYVHRVRTARAIGHAIRVRAIWIRRRKWHIVRRYNIHIANLRRRYAHFLSRERAHANAMRHLLALFRRYNHYYHLWLHIHRFARAYRVWLARRNHYIRRRRWLWAKRNHYYRVLMHRCLHSVRVWYWRCVLCRGPCGGHCWRMYHWRALMIVRRHMCKMQHILCSRRIYFLRKYHAWNRVCHHCWRKTHGRIRHLACCSKCGTRYKYYLFYLYYNRKCRR